MPSTDERLRDLEAAHPPPYPLLIELERLSAQRGVSTVSRTAGRFLSTIVTAMQANRILEVGTGYGYATLWMALAQPRAGRIWTIDSNEANADIAREHFRRAAKDDNIELFNTPALELLENFPHRNLDIALMTAGESEYLQYLDLVSPMLKLSGLAVFSNCLTMPAFAQRFLTHAAFEATILPFGIGIGARRK